MSTQFSTIKYYILQGRYTSWNLSFKQIKLNKSIFRQEDFQMEKDRSIKMITIRNFVNFSLQNAQISKYKKKDLEAKT